MINKTATSSQALKTAFRELMKGVYTCVPGYVITLLDDGQNQRAQIQLGVQRVDVSGASFEPKPIIDVPVLFLGGDFAVEYQIDQGCEGLVYFSQRCVDGWKNTGGIAQNPLGRFHDLQDAFFVPGFRSLPNVLPDFENNGIRLRNKSATQFAWLKNDGSIFVENGAGHIRLGADGVVTINGVTIAPDSLVTTPNDVVADGISVKDHVHTGVQAGGGNTGAPI